MPSEHQGVHAPQRETFPDIQDLHGEDPARFLDHPLLEHGEMMRVRIRGIDELALCRAWIAVERNIDRGPRDRVIAWLEEREAWLEDHGDRDERLPDEIERRDAGRETVEPAEISPTVVHESCGSTVEELDGPAGYHCPECGQKTKRVEVVDPTESSESAIATDGGERDGD